MENMLGRLLELSKPIPEEYPEETIEQIIKIREKTKREMPKTGNKFPYCGTYEMVKNGNKNKNKPVLENSHSSVPVWKVVIEDTVNGVSSVCLGICGNSMVGTRRSRV